MRQGRISIHAPREGSDDSRVRSAYGNSYISIHAPREGSDGTDEDNEVFGYQISIHAPREGSDWETCAYVARYVTFQSTLPVRGATHILTIPAFRLSDFNPRSP